MTGAPERPLVVLLSGPNLDLLGQREPEIYGAATLADHVRPGRSSGGQARARSRALPVEPRRRPDRGVHGARGRAAAIVVNAGALSHTSWALHDALAAFEGVVVELHLSNPAGREPFRHTSVIAPVADGLVAGFGGLGYELAIEAVRRLLDGGEAAPRP